jgi:hypothetical protein
MMATAEKSRLLNDDRHSIRQAVLAAYAADDAAALAAAVLRLEHIEQELWDSHQHLLVP